MTVQLLDDVCGYLDERRRRERLAKVSGWVSSGALMGDAVSALERDPEPDHRLEIDTVMGDRRREERRQKRMGAE